MENANELYERLIMLDKQKSKLETIKKNYFFENIDEKDINGEIEVPLVANSQTSDYEKLRLEKSNIENQIRYLKKLLDNPQYLKSQIISELRKINFTDEQIDEEIEIRLQACKTNIENCINNLKQRKNMIEEDPKTYLRFKECESCNYSRIKNQQVVKTLRGIDKEIKIILQKRTEVLKKLKVTSEYEEKTNKKSKLMLSLKFDKKNKKSIDNN